MRLSRYALIEVDRPEQLDRLRRFAADAEIGLAVFTQPPCSCDEARGCPPCFGRAEQLVGAFVPDHLGREWEVLDVGEKDGFPTLCGERYWDRPEEVQVLHEPSYGGGE